MIFTHCELCGRPLKSKRNMVFGLGSVCAKKLGLRLVGKKVVGKIFVGGLRPAKGVVRIKRFFTLQIHPQNKKLHRERLCVVNDEFYTVSEAKKLGLAAGF